MRCLALLTPLAAASAAYSEHEELLGKQVIMLSTGRVGQITGYTFDTEVYSFQRASAKLRMKRDEFEIAALRPGARVQLFKLDTMDLEGGDEFNGKAGTVTSVDDPSVVRVTLDVPAGAKKHWTFPEANLRIVGYASLEAIALAETLLHKRVRLEGRDQFGEVVAFEPEDEEYTVILDENAGAVPGLKADNLILLD